MSGLITRIARSIGAALGLADHGRDRLRRLVRMGVQAHRPRYEIVHAVAEEMYRLAVGAGAHNDQILGPWIYRRDAEEFVDLELCGAARIPER